MLHMTLISIMVGTKFHKGRASICAVVLDSYWELAFKKNFGEKIEIGYEGLASISYGTAI